MQAINSDLGFIPQEDQSTVFIKKIYGKWYRFKDIKEEGFLTTIIGADLAKLLISHFKRSLVIMRSAKSESDTIDYQKFIRVVKKSSIQ